MAKRKNSTETTLKNMSKKYNVPVGILKQVVRRGRGAFYSSGSRPGQTPTSWGVARARSFCFRSRWCKKSRCRSLEEG